MAIDFAKTFGQQAVAATTNAVQKLKAQFWLNIGYLTDIKDDQGEFRFVSLASGIPLDTMETLPTNSKNTVFAQFQAARNNVRDQLIAAAKTLKPGQSEIIGEANGLQIQIRRVSEEVEVAVGADNPFSRKILFGAPPAPATPETVQ